MKRAILSSIVLVFCLTATALAAAPTVILDGNRLSFDVPPIIENGSALVPLRAIFEALGATIQWDGATQTVTATKGSIIIKLTIGSQTAYKNETPVNLNVPGKITGGRTMVPLRFVSEALGAKVEWDDATQTINITSQSPAITYTYKDEAAFNEYFTELGLGKLPPGGQLPFDLQKDIYVFAPGDDIYLYGTVVKEVQPLSIIYDLNTKKPVSQKLGPPRPCQKGGFAGGSRFDLSPGKYEYRVYVGDAQIIGFPIEIR